MIKYSFIIPVKKINDYIRETVPEILKIQRVDYEILIFPDQKNSETWPKTKQIASGAGGPAMKRTLAIKHAKGQILIFIDDDSYPKSDILTQLDINFSNKNILAVGGPAITPRNDSFGQKLSGAVFSSSLSGGCPERYLSVGGKRFVDDWPSVNLSVKKPIFEALGGFNSNYWPGEDTLFCLELIKQTRTKILYNPKVIVYHHRRSGFLKHLKQVAGYGLHRGFFAKRYPKTSFKFKYFIPSLFVVFIISGLILSFLSQTILFLYLVGLGMYLLGLLIGLFQICKHEHILIAICSIPFIIGTHFSYGINFIRGLFKSKLISKLR